MVLLKGLWFCSKCDLVFLFLCCRWKARSHAILSVLKNLQADFFCLQVLYSCENFFFCVQVVLRYPFRMKHKIHSSLLFNPLDKLRPVKMLVLFVHRAFELCLTKGCLHLLVIQLQCSQEVDEYDSFYRNNMDSLGYSGIYIQRTGQRKRDGCAIFYKPSWYDKNIKRDKTLT